MPSGTEPRGLPAITRRVDLSAFGDGMDGSYAVVRLRTYRDVLDIRKQDFTDPNFDTIGYEISVVKDHFISGRILKFNSDGKTALADMTADDVEASPEVADKLYAVIMGITLDPKDLLKEAPSTGASSDSSNSTKTPSSTDQEISTPTLPETSSSIATPTNEG